MSERKQPKRRAPKRERERERGRYEKADLIGRWLLFLANADVMVGQGRMKNGHGNLRHVAIQTVRGRVDPASGLSGVLLGMTGQAFCLVELDRFFVVAMRVVASQTTQLVVTLSVASAESEGQGG